MEGIRDVENDVRIVQNPLHHGHPSTNKARLARRTAQRRIGEMKLNDFIDWRLPSGATFSECRRYRHTLWRTTGDCQFGNERICCIIMLNPSTADQSTDDPTIRRCRGFARDWAYGRLAV